MATPSDSPPSLNAPMGLKVHAMLALMTVIYGTFFPLLKLFCLEVSSIEVAFMRQLGFGVVIILFGWLWNVWKTLPIWNPQFKKDWPLFIGVAFFGVFWIQTFAAVAMGYTSSFHATLLMGTIPLQTMVLNRVLGIEKFTPVRLIGILMGTAGIGWLVASQVLEARDVIDGPNPLIGDGLIFLNAFFFALYNVWVKKLVKTYQPMEILSFNFLQAGLITLGLLFIGPFLPAFIDLPSLPELTNTFIHLTPVQWWYWIYIVVFAGLLGYYVHHDSLKKTSANNVAAYILLQPVIAALMGVWLLNEQFTINMGLAGVLTLSGLMVATVLAPRLGRKA